MARRPAGRRDADVSWLTQRPAAHRGLHGTTSGHPENSLAAFRAARDAGFPIELDVQLSRDGQVVVVHDRDLERLAGREAQVADLDAAELSAVRLSGTEEPIPPLAAVLEEIAGQVPLLIEIKRVPRIDALTDAVVALLRGYTGAAALMSFDPRALLVVRRHAFEGPVGQISGRLPSAPLPARALGQIMASNLITQPDFINYELDALPNRAVDFWRQRGGPLLAWTVHDRAEADRALELADSYVFEGFVPV